MIVIVIAIAGASIPVFALHYDAFATFALALSVPILAATSQVGPTASFSVLFSLLVSLYLIAAYFAVTQRSLSTIVENFLHLRRNDSKRFSGDAHSFIKVAAKRHERHNQYLRVLAT
ncbi:MAG: hypothetical protein ACU84Q_21255 [Gammaproteobacteria bacterium]